MIPSTKTSQILSFHKVVITIYVYTYMLHCFSESQKCFSRKPNFDGDDPLLSTSLFQLQPLLLEGSEEVSGTEEAGL